MARAKNYKSDEMRFIVNKQTWRDSNSDTIVIHHVIMESNGIASCRLSLYPYESVQVLSDVYVDEKFRSNGVCSKMLDFVDNNFRERRTLVYVKRDAREFIRKMYSKRGYIIVKSN